MDDVFKNLHQQGIDDFRRTHDLGNYFFDICAYITNCLLKKKFKNYLYLEQNEIKKSVLCKIMQSRITLERLYVWEIVILQQDHTHGLQQ